MKKRSALVVALLLLVSGLAGCAGQDPAGAAPAGNYSDEMKIPYAADLSPEDGSDSVERQGDHQDSPYFSRIDFFNAQPTDTLTVLERFETQQQTSEWSCGVSTAVMVLAWYDKLEGHNEVTLAALRTPDGGAPGATNLRQMIEMFNGAGDFDLYSTFDCADTVADVFTPAFVQQTLKAGNPVMIGWNDWGGHWQAIIGYDTMGTETVQDDVIIVADPYDTTDHNQDGYGVYAAERFLYNFTFYNFFPEEELNDMVFLIATPK